MSNVRHDLSQITDLQGGTYEPKYKTEQRWTLSKPPQTYPVPLMLQVVLRHTSSR